MKQTKQVGLPEEVINRFDKKYGVSKDDDLITTTRYSLLNDLAQARQEAARAERERIKDIIAMSAFNIDAGGYVSKRTESVEVVINEIMESLQKEQE